MATENKFPTIADYHRMLGDLVAKGFGDLPAQILIVPDSSLQAIARHEGNTGKPALMIEFEATDSRMPPSLISADRLTENGGMMSLKPH